MTGLEVERILDFVEEQTKLNRPLIRREVTSYLKANLNDVATSLAETGEVVIPTSFGGIKLTEDDLRKVPA